jgi:flavin reductase (DIM6/NTAB) family NADH-FMN oxidoreductase RutF
MLAGRFAAQGRPGARLMLEDVPHRRGPDSGALIVDGGLAALECAAERLITAGDHLVVMADVTSVVYVTDSGEPLIRFRSRYVLAGGRAPEPPVRFAPRSGYAALLAVVPATRWPACQTAATCGTPGR